MKKILAGGLLVLWTFLLPADVIMKLEIPRSNYMLFEPVVATLTMRNTSGQVLIFGTESEFKGHMEIGITDMHDRPLSGSGAKVNLKGMMLRPGVDHRIRVNLSKWINLNRVGYYKLKLFISHPMLKDEYESNFCTFDISAGKELWSRTFGVPQLDGKQLGENVKLRKYILRGLQDKSEVFLYLFVEDDQKIYTMKRLGVQLGREQTRCDIDFLNRLHMLIPVTPKLFRYYVFDWDGEQEINKVYRTSNSVPVLFRDATTGDVKIVGGELAQAGVDYVDEKLLPGVPVQSAEDKGVPQTQPKANK